MKTNSPPPKHAAPPKSNVIRLGDSMFRKSALDAALGPGDDAPPLLMWIDESDIDFNPFQPRTLYNPEKMNELAYSMKEHGQIQAAVVRRVGNRFQLGVGHRRLLTVRRGVNAGTKPKYEGQLRCEVRDLTDLQMRVFAVEENDAREDMNPIDRANAYQGIYDEAKKQNPKITWQDVSKVSKLTYRQMHREVQLLELPPEMKSALLNNQIKAAHGYVLLDLAQNATIQTALFRQIIKDGLAAVGAKKIGAAVVSKYAGSGQLSLSVVSDEIQQLAQAQASAKATRRKNRAALASGTAHLSSVAGTSDTANETAVQTGTNGMAQIPRLPQLTLDNMHSATGSLEWAAKGFDIMTVAPEDVAEFETEIKAADKWMRVLKEALKRHKEQAKTS